EQGGPANLAQAGITAHAVLKLTTILDALSAAAKLGDAKRQDELACLRRAQATGDRQPAPAGIHILGSRAMSNLATPFLHLTLPSPLVLASGIWGTTASLLERAAAAGCGAVTAKSCGPEPRAGHVNPSCLDWGHGLIN